MILPLFNQFLGHSHVDCCDEIEHIAKSKGYTVNVMDPEFNKSNISVDYHRLNVHTRDGKIVSFSIG